MRKNTGLTFLIILTAILLALLAGFYFFDYHKLFKKPEPSLTDQTQAMQQVEQLLNQSKPADALKILQQYASQIDAHSPNSQKWLDLLIRASTDSKDVFQLMYLYQAYPESFKNNEKASLLAADGFLVMGKSQEYENLRNLWSQQGTDKNRWFVLDADDLVIKGKPQDAIALLKSRTFEGKEDTPRLVRLALLHINDQPKVAWEYLSEAFKKDPDNPDIRSYRARLLEAVGRNQLALTEYLAAIDVAPNNLYLRDQLADYYQRQRQYLQALNVWSQAISPQASDRIWLKTIFWNKVITPIQFNWATAAPPEGKLLPLVNYLISLPPGTFWNNASFDKNVNLTPFLKSEQSTFWLRVIEELKKGNEAEALNIIQYNPFAADSWDPELEDALRKILVYRKTGSITSGSLKDDGLDVALARNEKLNRPQHPLFTALKEFSKKKEAGLPTFQLPEDIHDLVLSDEAFSALFIAAGWLEAGLQLHKMKVIPPTFPVWVPYDLTQAYRINRSNLEGLQFATLQNKTAPMSLLIAEMMIASDNPDAGLAELNKLSQEKSETGEQAAWLVALINVDQGKYEEAKKAINSQPGLASQVRGKEIMARIALLQGDLPQADKIYTAIEDSSIEAKSYLARKAFAEKNWTKARELTEQLLREFPTNDLLRANMQKIMEEINAENTKAATKPEKK